jgi:hypothetical protein
VHSSSFWVCQRVFQGQTQNGGCCTENLKEPASAVSDPMATPVSQPNGMRCEPQCNDNQEGKAFPVQDGGDYQEKVNTKSFVLGMMVEAFFYRRMLVKRLKKEPLDVLAISSRSSLKSISLHLKRLRNPNCSFLAIKRNPHYPTTE